MRGFSPSPVATALFALSKNYPVAAGRHVGDQQPVSITGNSLNNNQGDLKIDYVMSDKRPSLRALVANALEPTGVTGCVFCNAGAGEGSDQPVRNAVVDGPIHSAAVAE